LIALAEIEYITDGWIPIIESEKIAIIIVAATAFDNSDSNIDDDDRAILLSTEKIHFYL
jgi:hypothetical protein